MYLDEVANEVYKDLDHIKKKLVKETLARYFAGLPKTLGNPYGPNLVYEEWNIKNVLETRSRNLIHLVCSELRRDKNFEEIEQYLILPCPLITATVALNKNSSLWYKIYAEEIELGYRIPLKPVEDNLQELIEESKNFLKNSVDKNLIQRIMNRILKR